jgi:ABC-type phosphate/phosphonate transport system substrate-binding protein
VPEALFRAIVDHVAARTGLPSTLELETATSGPLPGGRFTADVAFLCAPAYRQLGSAVALLGAAPVFASPRAAGRPVLHSEVVVPRASAARGFADLAGGVWAYNDVCSLSGYHSMRRRLAGIGAGPTFFRELRHAGSHLAALAQVGAGVVDVAAVDSNVLALARRRDPGLDDRVRVLETLGPFPVQPVVARASLCARVRARITAALLAVGDALAHHGLEGFAPVTHADYERF